MSALKRFLEDRQMAEQESIRKVMSTPEGRRFVRYILRISGTESSPWGSNAAETARSIGRLEVGRDIDAICLRVAPDSWAQMHAESAGDLTHHARLEEAERK